MKRKLSGSEFVAEVSASVVRNLVNVKWIELLYDACGDDERDRLFGDLAFEAKSYRKLSRLQEAGIADANARGKITTEIAGVLARFSHSLETISSQMNQHDGELFANRFLRSDPDSFANLIALVEDFSSIKDFYLAQRDNKR